MAYTTIDDPTIYFNTITYSGNGSNGNAITGVGFSPEWLWIKQRSGTRNHNLWDIVRGNTKRLISNTTGAETTETSITSFDSDRFTLDSGTTSNENSQTFVAWNWKAGGTASSNSNGSITSSVSASTTAGFSIVSYTGNGNSSQTVGHGLGTTPAWIIVKNRDQTDKWSVFHQSLANGANSYIELDQTGTPSNLSLSPPYWGTPSSTTFGGLHFDSTNASGEKYIAYCFAEKKGYSKFGSYVGNNNDDGTFVYLGFKPAWLLIKIIDTQTDNWIMQDNKRNTFNLSTSQRLRANSSGAEFSSSNEIDLLANGFKCHGADGEFNGSGASYIYMAFAESPLVNSNGVPATAR